MIDITRKSGVLFDKKYEVMSAEKGYNIVELLSNYLKDNDTEKFAEMISEAINKTGMSRSQSFTVHKKVSDKLIAISKINIQK